MTGSGGSRRASGAGIGVAATEPLYVLRSDPRTNTLVVGPRRALACTPCDGARAPATCRSSARRRSSATAPSRCRPRVAPIADGFALDLDEPVDAVAPGQVAVLYDDDAVVGAGVIERATG